MRSGPFQGRHRMIEGPGARRKATGMTGTMEVGSARSRILAAAGALLEESGSEDISLRCLAARADIGLATIYSHFENKEALLLRLALRGFGELRGDLVRARDRTDSDLGPMRRTARAYLSFAADRGALFALMFDPGLMSRHEDLRAAEYDAFAVYLESVTADERLPAETRADCAMAVWALGRGMTAMRASHPGGKLPKEMDESLARGIAWMLDR